MIVNLSKIRVPYVNVQKKSVDLLGCRSVIWEKHKNVTSCVNKLTNVKI